MIRTSLSLIAIALALLACSRDGTAANNASSLGAATEGDSSAAAPDPNQFADLVVMKPTAPAGEQETFPFGTVQRSAIWRKAGWTPTNEKPIAVCWENPQAVDPTYRAAVQDAVTTTWQKESMLRFTGWGRCAGNKAAEDIRIFAADDGPHVKALGRYLDDYPQGMALNFQFSKWSPSCQQKREFCARVIAVHQFGHALGFAHEQNRDDAPFECRRERQGTNGDWNIISYDPQSVMNYCNVVWSNNGILSSRDVQAVTTLYGRRA